VLARVGNVSYSAYLWHVPTLIVLERFLGARASYALLPLYLVVVAAIAMLSRRFLEPPFAGWASIDGGASGAEPRASDSAYAAREREPTASAVRIAAD
jgi:peptidoglycan/LPS O-acetylase OafA/YrhL